MEQEKKKRNKSIVIGGQKYYTQFSKKFEERKIWEVPNPNLLKAVIPGNIEKIFAKEGKGYKKGEILLTFKAMKMENSLLMPFTGKVKKIYVEQGEILKKNQLLIELE